MQPLLLHIEKNQLRWFMYLTRLPTGHLLGQVFSACLTGRKLRGTPRIYWRDRDAWRARECIGVHSEELDKVSEETTAPHDPDSDKGQKNTGWREIQNLTL